MKTSVLVKIDTIICQHNMDEIKNSFSLLVQHHQLIKKNIQEKKNKGFTSLTNLIAKKQKYIMELCLKKIVSIANEKKLMELQIKMMSRVLT